ncbi:MAG: TIGR00289 family protein, partial [Halobacteria archaeon]
GIPDRMAKFSRAAVRGERHDSGHLPIVRGRMRLAALVSGGKDSSWCLWKASQQGHTVACLVSLRPENPDSYMFQSQNVHLTDLFAEACGLPLIVERTPGEKERELEDLRRALARAKERGCEGVVAGAVASRYQKERVETLCRGLGLALVAPLWGADPLPMLREVARDPWHVLFVHVAALGLGPEWLGRRLDDAAVGELLRLRSRHGLHVSGEGGEYETLVLDAPFFRKRIEILRAERSWKGDRGTLFVREARLAAKEVPGPPRPKNF